MGCVDSRSALPEDVYKKSAPPSTPPGCFTDNYFTQQEKILVKQTWQELDNSHIDKGQKIFLRIFEKAPEAKQLFPFRDLSGEELMRNPTFRGHAKRFVHAVGNTINNIDALDVCCTPTLLTLGRKHVAVVEFLDQYMEIFIEAIQYVFEKELGKESTPEVHKAWSAVFRYICAKILEGYNQALEELTLKSNSSLETTNKPECPNGTVNGGVVSNNMASSGINNDDCHENSEKLPSGQTILGNGTCHKPNNGVCNHVTGNGVSTQI